MCNGCLPILKIILELNGFHKKLKYASGDDVLCCKQLKKMLQKSSVFDLPRSEQNPQIVCTELFMQESC
jgi:hypothetical protein